jgi:hypothetical protein
MKYLFFIMILFIGGCKGPFLGSGFDLVLPELPPVWTEILGPPAWRLEWINSRGRWETLEIGLSPAEAPPGLWRMPVSGTSPVLAWPFWPEMNIPPGDFRPAGAIFPFDAAGGDLVLSWEGGVAAFFYCSLAEVFEAGLSPNALRRPENFNWPRFMELFRDPALKDSFRADPWTADWKLIARDTVEAGFEKRLLVSAPRDTLAVPVHPGPWIGSSPFPPPLLFGEDPPVFPVPPGTEPDTWYSTAGILRCTRDAWIFLPRGP